MTGHPVSDWDDVLAGDLLQGWPTSSAAAAQAVHEGTTTARLDDWVTPASPLAQAEHQVDYRLVRTLQGSVADRLTTLRQEQERGGRQPLSTDDERQLALSIIREAVTRHIAGELAAGRDVPADASYDQRLCEAVEAAIYGAGQLQELLDNTQIENIDINGCDEVWVTYADGRGKVRGQPVAASDDELIDMVRTLGAYGGLNARPFTPANPELDLRLPDGSRLSAVMLASERPAVSIRRNRFSQMFLDEVPPHAPARGAQQGPMTLLELGTVDAQLASFLKGAVLSRANIIVAGATDAGKTTLLRALINCVPPQERLVTVERALELGLRRHPALHPDVVELEEVLPSPDAGGGVTIGALVRRSRRQNPSRVIVGEVLGPEVVEMLSAMSQGNNGSLSTIHARDAVDVFRRLSTYAAQHEGLSFEVTNALIGASIDFVVFVRKNPKDGGRRAVMEVVEVTGSGDGDVTRARIWAESPETGRAQRDPEVQIARWKQLAEAGYDDTSAHWARAWPGRWSQ